MQREMHPDYLEDREKLKIISDAEFSKWCAQTIDQYTLLPKNRLSGEQNPSVDIEKVLGQIDAEINNGVSEEKLLLGLCGPITAVKVCKSPYASILPKQMFTYNSQFMTYYSELGGIFDVARNLGKQAGLSKEKEGAGIVENMTELEGKFIAFESSHPYIIHAHINAWAEQVTRERFPEPQGLYNKDAYDRLINIQQAMIVERYRLTLKSRKELDIIADSRNWEKIQHTPLQFQQEQLHNPKIKHSNEKPYQSIEDYLMDITLSEQAYKAYNLYSQSHIGDFEEVMNNLPRDIRAEVLGQITRMITLLRLPFTQETIRPPKDIPATPLIKDQYTNIFNAEQKAAAYHIEILFQFSQIYKALQENPDDTMEDVLNDLDALPKY